MGDSDSNSSETQTLVSTESEWEAIGSLSSFEQDDEELTSSGLLINAEDDAASLLATDLPSSAESGVQEGRSGSGLITTDTTHYVIKVKPDSAITTSSTGESNEDELKPVTLTRQQSFELQHNFDDEPRVKERRAAKWLNPNMCKNKTRRRKCRCVACREFFRGTLTCKDVHIPYDVEENDALMITDFDLLNLPRSLNKRKNWEHLHDNLKHVALSCSTSGRGSDIRRTEEFHVEAIGTIVTHAMKDKQSMEESARTDADRRDWKNFESGCYYALPRVLAAQRAADGESLSAYVRQVHRVPNLDLDNEEVICDFVPTFRSRATSPQKYTKMGCAMIAPLEVKQELRSVSRAAASYWNLSSIYPITSESSHYACWASKPALTNKTSGVVDETYDDWSLDMDLRRNRTVRAVLIQGRAPKLTSFPNHSSVHFDQARKYHGPLWPVVVDGTDQQWVERVEISVRREGGAWVSLKNFKANEDCFNVVRIDLTSDFFMERPVRYIRVRPLSKRVGGYHGDAPAMRVAVVGEKNENNRGIYGNPVEDRNRSSAVGGLDLKTLVVYELKTPDEKISGVNPGASYVSGRAISQCSTASHYNHAGLSCDNTRFQKKKAFQAMLKNELTTEDDEAHGNTFALERQSTNED